MQTIRTAIDNQLSFETAAQHLCREVPRFDSQDRVDDVRQRILGKTYGCASLIIVLHADRFQGIVRIEDFLAAAPDRTLDEIMDRDPPTAAPGVDQEVAAWHAVSKSESALCVVDSDSRFLGVIPPDRLLAVLLSEHEEDLSRLGGFTQSSAASRSASEEPVGQRYRHRLPWLLVGLVGALLSADFVGWFEMQLQQKVMLAFFIPGIIYLADAVGTQTETVVVRGLSIGVPMRRMISRELLSGILIGLTLSLVAGLLIWWRWEDSGIAICVALAVFTTCSTASVVAMTLPWILTACAFDPAFGSGPLATVIQDLLSIVIYFAIATPVLM